MTRTPRKGEILAPAGSAEQLVAAVNNGCDSVYLGLESFNARLKAPNFTRENLRQWVDFCHIYGVKVYVTLNTSLKNDELGEAVDVLKTIYLSNADGVIVTDLALMRLAAKLPKPFDVVASTQLNVHNRSGATFAAKCGATTVVCARESTLYDIKEIAQTGVNVECFVHGATCVCQSGQCLFSAMVGGNSGNRGLCAQPCRKLYSANDAAPAYLLSARDLCGLDVAKELFDAGVSTFKIEGRNRRAEYAGITSRAYRNLFDDDFCYDKTEKTTLAEIYNRDMSSLDYLYGGNGNIISPKCQNHAGVAVGEVCGKGLKTFVRVCKGDGFKIFRDGKEACGAVATSSGSGEVSAEFGGKVHDGLEAHRTTSVELSEEILSRKKLLPVELTFCAQAGKCAKLVAKCNDIVAEVESDFVVPAAQNSPTTEEELTRQLQKSGNSYYTISHIVVEIGNIFLAKSQINALRREALKKLTDAIIQGYDERFSSRKQVDDSLFSLPKPQKKHVKPRLAVICYNAEQLKKACDKAEILIYKPEQLGNDAFETAKSYGAYLDLPSFTTTRPMFEKLKEFSPNVMCHNIGQVEWARELQLRYIAGSGLNIYNDCMAEIFSDAETFVYSLELTLAEISAFSNRGGLIFVDGKIPLMKLVHCPYKVVTGCNCSSCKGEIPLTYTDEQGNEFEVERRKEARCTFELLNGKKLSVANRLKRADGYLIDFNEAVLEHYSALNAGKIDDFVEPKPYTKGRLFDKVN